MQITWSIALLQYYHFYILFFQIPLNNFINLAADKLTVEIMKAIQIDLLNSMSNFQKIIKELLTKNGVLHLVKLKHLKTDSVCLMLSQIKQ